MNDEPRVERCEVCRFWDPGDGTWHSTCRRYPPVLNPVALQSGAIRGPAPATPAGAADLRYVWAFPRVDEDEWCGEFRPRGEDGPGAGR